MMAETKNTKAFYNTEIPGDWEVVHLEMLAQVKGRVGWKGYKTEDLRESGPLVIGASHIDEDNKLDLNNPTHLSREKYDESPEIIVKKNDIVFVQRGSLGKVAWIKSDIGEATINPSMVLLKPLGNNAEYLYYFLCSEFIDKNIKEVKGATGVPMLSQKQISNFKISKPKGESEQKAIAQVLSTADAAIHTTEKLIAQKELRKKWLMQQLLTGKKRLKGFGGEWKFVRFKEIYSQVKQKAGDEKFLVLSVTKDGIVSQAEYFNKEIASEDTSPYLVVRKGDMAMSGLNFWMGSIDVLVEYEIGMVSPAYKVFEIHNPEISATFMKSFVRSEIMLQCLIGSSVVGASIVRRNLDRETLDEWSFRLPLLEEQTAIAQVLQAADKEISLLKAKAVKLREQKKGLMQQLLTGKVRLKINNT
jgi:type I restriction enzyme S subunit